MEIKGVIFDLDGTLVHTIDDLAGAANAMLQRHGFPVHGVGRYLEWIGNGAAKLIERALPQSFPDSNLMEFVAEFKEIYAGQLHRLSRVYEGIPEALDSLVENGIRIAILSNKPHLLTLQVAEYYLARWPFDPIFGQREGVPRKPDPAGAVEIAAHLGYPPEKILFVGDSENDFLTARSAGMVPILVGWGYGRLDRKKVAERSVRIGNPAQIPELIMNHKNPER